VEVASPIAGFVLKDGPWFYVTSHEIQFEGQEFRIPAAGNRTFDFLIARNEAPSSVEAARILIMNKPNDGDKMIAWEYRAVRCDTKEHTSVEATITPQQIYHSTSWE
jgi:hypothetical protein